MKQGSSLVKLGGVHRCWWCGNDPLYMRYHDEEWGVPLHDNQRLFEMLLLEGFQAGLSWITVLRKRENYRRAFLGFDAEKIARFDRRKVEALLGDPGIIRNRAKIEAAIKNAQAYLKVMESEPSFDHYLWSFTGFETLRSRKRPTRETIRATSPESDALSKDLKKRGFSFVGSTIIYAHMQATGMVDDHVAGCFRAKRRKSPSQ